MPRKLKEKKENGPKFFRFYPVYHLFMSDRNKKPINYKPKILPRSQDAKPIIQETTGLYGIKRR